MSDAEIISLMGLLSGMSMFACHEISKIRVAQGKDPSLCVVLTMVFFLFSTNFFVLAVVKSLEG